MIYFIKINNSLVIMICKVVNKNDKLVFLKLVKYKIKLINYIYYELMFMLKWFLFYMFEIYCSVDVYNELCL